MENERVEEAPKAPARPQRRGSVKRRQPRVLTTEDQEKAAQRIAAKKQQRQSSDLCASLPIGVAEVLPGGVKEIVRWRCPKDMRILFSSLVVEHIEPGAMFEARLRHNDEYLGSVPIAVGSNSAFLALKEIAFIQFDLIYIELSLPPTPLKIAPPMEGGPSGAIEIVAIAQPVTIGPIDFIIRYK